MNFSAWHDYLDFEKSVSTKSRFFVEKQASLFLENLLQASEKRKKVINEGTVLWRAQLGAKDIANDNRRSSTRGPFDAERMKPSLTSVNATNGRANPAGVSYLYLASDQNTAMSEMRPWVGAEVTCAEFRSKREFVVADFVSKQDGAQFLPKNQTPADIEATIFFHVNSAFSRPITPEDSATSYVPTQIIAEYFRNHKYDGIGYKSGLGAGYNFVFFDVDAFLPVSGQLFKVDSVDWKFIHSLKVTY